MSKHIKKPHLINFPKIGNPHIGYISIAENKNLPIVPKRIYWTYFTPENIIRGGHAHINLEQILIAVSGTINLSLETDDGEKFDYLLNSPDKGVYIPNKCWRTMKYSHNAVQICIANMTFLESDYINSYEQFKKIK